MLESVKNNRIQYQKLTEQEKQDRQILGTLVGPCADIINPTRNGRTYSEKLWEKVFNAPLVKEQLNAGGIFGELEHPDYDEVNPEKIAVVMPEAPKKGADGLLYGYWHILNTPCGKILKTLVDYGYKPGISTRGNGDIIQDYDGNESVDPDTYQLNALDIVLIPAVEKARLELAESLNTKKPLKESLKELVDNSSDEDKKIMNESLAQLNITLTSENAGEAREVSIPVDMTVSDNGDVKIETVDTIPEDDPGVIGETPEITVTADVVMQAQSEVEQEVETEIANSDVDNSVEDDNIQAEVEDDAVDNVEVSVIDDLQEALKQNGLLKQSNENLQNSLSVSIAKEQQLDEQLNRCKNKIAELVESQKKIIGLQMRSNKLQENVETLTESVNQMDSKTQKLEHTINLQKINIHQLSRQNERMEIKQNSLREKLALAHKENENIKQDYMAQLDKQSNDNNSLTENLNNQIDNYKNINEKLSIENKKLKSQLSSVIESYARLKSQISGVDFDIIKDNIKNNSIEDIDRLTESYMSRKMIERKLPFTNDDIKKIRYNRPIKGYTNPINSDDVYSGE